MQITRSSIETTAGPSEWFTGAVYLDAVAAPSGVSRLSASSVHFTPGARTAALGATCYASTPMLPSSPYAAANSAL